jgi:mannosyltransferase OCH1-like enzyme
VRTQVQIAQGKVRNEYIQNTYFTVYSVTTHILLKKAWQVNIDNDKWNSNSGNVLKRVRNSVYSIITLNVSLSLFPLSWFTIGRI